MMCCVVCENGSAKYPDARKHHQAEIGSMRTSLCLGPIVGSGATLGGGAGEMLCCCAAGDNLGSGGDV